MPKHDKPARTRHAVAFMVHSDTPGAPAQTRQPVEFGHAAGLPQSEWGKLHRARANALREQAAAMPATAEQRAALLAEAAYYDRRAVTGGNHSREARDDHARAANIARSQHADS